VRLGELVRQMWACYGADILISEASHWGEHRACWMDQVADEVEKLLQAGLL
jgi:hypothetical protein